MTTQSQEEKPDKVNALLEQFGMLTPAEGTELKDKMFTRFGLPANDVIAVVSPHGVQVFEPVEESKFDVILVSPGEHKVNCLKAVREITMLGLKECKEIVDTSGAVLKTGLIETDALEIKRKIEAEGGKVELRKVV